LGDERMNDLEINHENKVRKILKEKIIPIYPDIQVLESKVVADIIICRNGNNPNLFFLEIKHWSYSKNRIGFGSKNKVTFQPEILLLRPKFFEKNMRWVFFKENDTSFYVLSNEDCNKYIMGKNIDIKKQNNFKEGLYRDIPPFDEQSFIQWLIEWLSS
jgi:hypothetical protein